MSHSWDDRRRALEEEYFKRKEREALEKMRAQLDDAQDAMENVAAAHRHMQCPRCDGTLNEVGHEGVRIDICNKCGGVWLDSGELEQLTTHEDQGGGWLSRMLGRTGE